MTFSPMVGGGEREVVNVSSMVGGDRSRDCQSNGRGRQKP